MSNRYQQLPENKVIANLARLAKQQGSSLVLALVVIIILTLLGSVLMRMISTSSETVSQEVLGTRAYMAANSAMQGELQRLFPPNVVSSGYCDSEVTQVTNDYDFTVAIPGLYDCRAKTQCIRYHTDSVTETKYFRLTSTGKCGSGVMAADSKNMVNSSRTIQVEARSL